MESNPSHNHQACIDQALRCADQICRQRGLRWTPLRRQVLELIWESHQAVKAYDLLAALQASVPGAKPATVYRSLAFLLQQGLVHRIESLNAYVGCNHADTEHNKLFLICDECQNIEEREAYPVTHAVEEETTSARFTAHHQALEIHGICRRCRDR